MIDDAFSLLGCREREGVILLRVNTTTTAKQLQQQTPASFFRKSISVWVCVCVSDKID